MVWISELYEPCRGRGGEARFSHTGLQSISYLLTKKIKIRVETRVMASG